MDLGAAPGGWSQVVAEKIGEEGTGQVISVDLEYIKPIDHEAYTGVKGDFTKPEIQEIIIELIDGKADIILSDASPKLTGIKDIDNFKAYQNIVIPLGDFFFPLELTFKINKAFFYHRSIYHIGFYSG